MGRKTLLLMIFALTLPHQAKSMNIDHRLTEAKQELRKNSRALHEACNAGDLEKVKLLIEAGADVNAIEFFNLGSFLNLFTMHGTPLHIAAKRGFKEIAKLLIDSGALVGMRCNKSGKLPLHLAADQGWKEVAELLIKEKASIDAQDASGSTPLHDAIIKNRDEIVSLFLKYNADIAKTDHEGWASFHLAAFGGYNGIVELLIADSFFLPICTRAYNYSQTLKELGLEFLLQKQKAYDILKNNLLRLEDWSALLVADHVPLDIQREIVKAWKLQKNEDQLTALFNAHLDRHLALLKRCLDCIVNRNNDFTSDPQSIASQQKHQAMVKILSHVKKAESFSSLDKNLQEKIRKNIIEKIF